MVIVVTRREKDRTYFDKNVKFRTTKDSYVNDWLPIGAVYEVEVKGALCEPPSPKNRIK